MLIGCGKTAPDQQTTPKVEPIEAKLTPGMKVAKKAHDEGRYADAVRMYTAELATEEAKSAPSWVQLSHLNNQLGLALGYAGQYDKALEYYQKSLAIKLKQLGPDHPSVANSYHNIAFLYKDKKDLPKAKEYWEKAHAICLKKLGPDHPHTKLVKDQLDTLKE
jgi:tetratricopeptide (TPR) repeat protein